jgi:hypothetical protein
LDILHRPKGENRTAHGLQPWEDVPERIALKGRPSAGHYSQRKRSSKATRWRFRSSGVHNQVGKGLGIEYNNNISILEEDHHEIS